MKFSLVLSSLFLSFSMQAQTNIMHFQSSERMTSLLELYTSEGCSSCPPAESWLSRQKDAPGLWKDFVPVAFHVDYWDHLGWRDPWSSQNFSDRQREYAAAWNTETIYTPEFVVNGREWHRWGTIPRSKSRPGVLSVTSTNGIRWSLHFSSTATAGNYELHAALLACGVASDVKAGENRGRKLQHDFAVASLTEKLLRKRDDGYFEDFFLKPDSRMGKSCLAIAVWITRAGELTPLQATGGWLP